MALSIGGLQLNNPWLIGGVVVGGALLAWFLVRRFKPGTTGSVGTAGPNESRASQANAAGGQPIYVIETGQYVPPGADTGTAIAPVPGTPPGMSGGDIPPTPKPTPGGQSQIAWDQSGGNLNLLPGGGYGGGPAPRAGPPPAPQPQQPPAPTQTPPTPPAQYVHPMAWPSPVSYLSGIASANGVSLASIEGFPENQYIGQRPGGWNLVYTSDLIRIR